MRSHRMKPGKGLTSHGTSNGANHLESLITKIAKSSLSHWILINPSLSPSSSSWPSVLELSSTNSRQFPLPPGAAAPLVSHCLRGSRDLGSDRSRDPCAGLSLAGSRQQGTWLAESGRCSCGNVGEHLPWSLWGYVSNLVNCTTSQTIDDLTSSNQSRFETYQKRELNADLGQSHCGTIYEIIHMWPWGKLDCQETFMSLKLSMFAHHVYSGLVFLYLLA